MLAADGVPICIHEQGEERTLLRLTGVDADPRALPSTALPPLKAIVPPATGELRCQKRGGGTCSSATLPLASGTRNVLRMTR